MRKLLAIIGFAFICLSSYSEVWKGVNLKFLTDAHNDFVKEIPCIVETVNYELIEMFGEVSKGKQILKKVVSYDDKGYITSEVKIEDDKRNEILYNNEYSGERIVKRTAFKAGDVVYVYKYSYNNDGVIINKYNGLGRLVDRKKYKVVGGVLQQSSDDVTTSIEVESSTVTKYNSMGFPIESVKKNPAFNSKATFQYDKGLIVKNSAFIRGISVGTIYSDYKTNAKGDWVSRRMTPILKINKPKAQYGSMMTGGTSEELLMVSMLGDRKPEIQERAFFDPNEYVIFQRTEEQRKKEEEKKQKISEEIEREKLFLSNMYEVPSIPTEYIKHDASVSVNLKKAVSEIENLRNGDVPVSPINLEFLITIGDKIDVRSVGPNDSSDLKILLKALQQSEFKPFTLYLEHQDTIIIVPRSLMLSIKESRKELISPQKESKVKKIFNEQSILEASLLELSPGLSRNDPISIASKVANNIKPTDQQNYKYYTVDIKLKKDKSTGQWLITNWDKILKNGYDKASLEKGVLKYINFIKPNRKSVTLRVRSYCEPEIIVNLEAVDDNTHLSDYMQVYKLEPEYRFEIR